jgi:thioredoxin-like negative regulator of GroEL
MRRKIVFAPGSFDNFEGTQEELDTLVDQVVESLESVNFENQVAAWDLDDLVDIDPAIADAVLDSPTKRTLH